MILEKHHIEALWELIERQPKFPMSEEECKKDEFWVYPIDIKNPVLDLLQDLGNQTNFLQKQVKREKPVNLDNGSKFPMYATIPARKVNILDILGLIAKFSHRELRKRAQKYLRIIRRRRWNKQGILLSEWGKLESVKFFLENGFPLESSLYKVKMK